MNVTNLLDFALPYSAEDGRCGMKKKRKTERRLMLAIMLNDLRKGKQQDFTSIELMIDYPTFERKVSEWIGSLNLKQS